jgi:hypothetical protein
MTAWRAAVGTLALTAMAANAAAQSAPYRYRTVVDQRVTSSAFLVTFGTTYMVQVFEGLSTANAVEAGARETNPLVAPFTSRPGMFAFSVARATALNVAIGSIGKRHKAAAIVIGAALDFSYVFIASHNHDVAAAMRKQRRRLGLQ